MVVNCKCCNNLFVSAIARFDLNKYLPVCEMALRVMCWLQCTEMVENTVWLSFASYIVNPTVVVNSANMYGTLAGSGMVRSTCCPGPLSGSAENTQHSHNRTTAHMHDF